MKYLSIIGLLFSVIFFSSCRTRSAQSGIEDIEDATKAERCGGKVIVTCNDGSQELVRSISDFKAGRYCRNVPSWEFRWVHAGAAGADIILDRPEWYKDYPSCRLGPNMSARIIYHQKVNKTSNKIEISLGAIEGCPLWLRGYVHTRRVVGSYKGPGAGRWLNNKDASTKKIFTCEDLEKEEVKFPGYLSYD